MITKYACQVESWIFCSKKFWIEIKTNAHHSWFLCSCLHTGIDCEKHLCLSISQSMPRWNYVVKSKRTSFTPSLYHSLIPSNMQLPCVTQRKGLFPQDPWLLHLLAGLWHIDIDWADLDHRGPFRERSWQCDLPRIASGSSLTVMMICYYLVLEQGSS